MSEHKTNEAADNEAFLQKATEIGQRSVAFQRYIQNSNCVSEAGMARMAGLVALEYLAEMAAAHGLANKPALDRDAVIEAAREFGRSYLVTRTGKDVLEKYVWIRWLMADFHIAQTQKAAQPAESEVLRVRARKK